MKKGIIISLCILLTEILLPAGIFSAKLSDENLSKKKEGLYPTGLPLINYSSDDGFGYGVRAYLFYNGYPSDKYYDNTPYFMQLYGQYFATTEGIYYHEINLDMPYILDTRFRVKFEIVFDKNLNANYFGTGAYSANAKLTDNDGNTYNKYSDYFDDFLDVNKQFYKWNKYTITRPKLQVNIYHDLTDEFKVLGGLMIQKVDVNTWDGKNFDGALQMGTLLTRERPKGYEGGWTNIARIGIVYDTRDFEPDPTNGIFIDYAFHISDSLAGSDYHFIRNTAGARSYVTLIDSLVLALRAAYTDVNGNIPFYEMMWFGFALNRFSVSGLGGSRTLRGFKRDRFVGKTMTMANAELRWQFIEVTGGSQRFGFKIVGFVDTGNVYDSTGDPFTDPRWGDYHHSYGCGLAVAWNLSTIIHAYYGISKEDTGFVIDFEHNF